MANDGIARLISVTQMKSNSANDDALNGADKQRGLLKEQKLVRDQLRAFDDKVKDKKVTPDELDQIRGMLAQAGLDTGSSSLGGLTDGEYTLGAEGIEKTNQDVIDSLRNRLDDKSKNLEGEDKLGNFEIQDLMSQYNQAEQLASNVLKKRDDTSNAIIGKV
jgi:hypothetical protein